MKNVKLEVFNGKTQFVKSIELHQSTGQSKIVGTCINSLFQFNERLRKYGASHFKATDELSIVISTDSEVVLDSYMLNSEYGFKLKFGRNSKSKRKFASCLNDLMIWAVQEIKPVTLDEVIDSLED